MTRNRIATVLFVIAAITALGDHIWVYRNIAESGAMQFVQRQIETFPWLKQRVGDVREVKPKFFGKLAWNIGLGGDRTVKFQVDLHGTLGHFDLYVILDKNVDNWHLNKCWLDDEKCVLE
jgi:hypothetical protein